MSIFRLPKIDKYLTLVLLVAAVLRFSWLGDVPQGVSPEEAGMGIFIRTFTHIQITNIMLLRLPFALLGILSIYLFYVLLEKIVKKGKLPLMAAALLAITPWHIQESRIFSWGLLIFSIILIIFLVYFRFFINNAAKITKFAVLAGVSLLAVSLLDIPMTAKNNVDHQRNIASKILTPAVTKVFSNKLVESYRYRENIFFENLDFGNYFFSGYPRPRWGYEDYQKLFIVFLPFLAFGAIKSQKRELLLLISLFLAYALILTALGLRDPSFGLPLLLIIIPLTADGLNIFTKVGSLRILGVLFALLLIFELSYFSVTYKLGINESRFSKRSVVYPVLTQKALRLSDTFENIAVTGKLSGAKVYFEFYAPEIYKKIAFSDFDIKGNSSSRTLYVGVLPFDASPNEQLFKKDGKWPEYINVLDVTPDLKQNIDIVIFSSKL